MANLDTMLVYFSTLQIQSNFFKVSYSSRYEDLLCICKICRRIKKYNFDSEYLCMNTEYLQINIVSNCCMTYISIPKNSTACTAYQFSFLCKQK